MTIRVATVLLFCGCGHVTLPVVPREAPYGSRVEAYQQLRPVSRDVGVLLTGTHQRFEESTSSLTLGNGVVVEHPIDLLPAVLPASLTAKRILDYEARRAPWNIWGGIAVGSVVTGTVLLLSSLLLPSSQSGAANGMQIAGVSMAVVGPLSSLIIGGLTVGNTAPDRERCFASYEEDLRTYLDVSPATERP